MPVFLSCGHECSIRPISGFPLLTKDFTREGSKCTKQSVVCHSCYLSYVKDYPDSLIFEESDIEDYLAPKEDSGDGGS